MTAGNILAYTIIVLVIVGYSQPVLSHSLKKLGTNSRPAKSCREIYDYNIASRGQSGYYWIKTDNTCRVYCDMELTCGGITGGWM